MQRGVGADRHVGAEHVVVDRADEPDERKVRCASACASVDVAGVDELVEQVRPLGAQLSGSAETAVAADDDQRVDASLDEVARRSA